MNITIKVFGVIIAAMMTVSMAGCVSISESYSNADKYSAGNTGFNGSDVRSLDINWSCGKVTVSRHDQDTVTVTESSKDDLKDSQKVRTWLDGNILRIQFCKSGEAFFFKQVDKELEVKIPMDMELDDIDYDGSAGGLFLEEITAATIEADVSSGTVSLTDCSAKEIDAESSSGVIIIGQKGESDIIKADTSSGSVEIKAEKVGRIEADTSSGRIEVNADEAGKVETESSSGKNVLRFGTMPSETEIDTSSGDVKVCVPENAGFTLDIDTSSGDFDYDVPLSKDGGSYISGDGSSKVKIDTSSGDIYVTN